MQLAQKNVMPQALRRGRKIIIILSVTALTLVDAVAASLLAEMRFMPGDAEGADFIFPIRSHGAKPSVS
jgi:predicted dinucleotide-utilizing enzyme